jgi:hypothetical protein
MLVDQVRGSHCAPSRCLGAFWWRCLGVFWRRGSCRCRHPSTYLAPARDSLHDFSYLFSSFLPFHQEQPGPFPSLLSLPCRCWHSSVFWVGLHSFDVFLRCALECADEDVGPGHQDVHALDPHAKPRPGWCVRSRRAMSRRVRVRV